MSPLLLAIFLLFVTFVVEAIIASLILWKLNREVWGVVFIVNLFTWPIANFLYGLDVNLFMIEAGVVVIEIILLVLLLRIRYWKAGLISLIANSLSALIGYLLTLYLGYGGMPLID